eukprot:TRINITY_DN859_c0_g1_i9.p1 TRINITY_DN859_c0_g1~~TRINITY_DN859_c0_g1_i9.p1  ORF type:complete len:154 (+),score=20.85 TRINITY_DN859_c0_g1_i9:431-892(+)
MITQLPLSMSQLQNLQEFSIFDTDQSTTIRLAPSDIRGLRWWRNLGALNKRNSEGVMVSPPARQNIQYFQFHNANLTEITYAIPSFACCDCVNISGNQISTLPSSISTLTELKFFKANRNQLTEIPHELVSMSQLEYLRLCFNQLSSLPDTCF